MQKALRPSNLVPPGFKVVSAVTDGEMTVVTVRATSKGSTCPCCGSLSERVRSRYCRCVGDLPLAGRQVRLIISARRFKCDCVSCKRRIFTERYDSAVLVPWARRTARLDYVVHQLGLALGGRPAASFASRLMVPVSNDTLLRVVRRRSGKVPWLDEQWAAGHRNGAKLWRRLKGLGFRGSLRVVTEWATRRRRSEKADAESLQRIPSARTIARLMTVGRDTLSKAETVLIAAIEGGVPPLVEARDLVANFHTMIRKKATAELDPWVEQAKASLLSSFANGVAKDHADVSAAISSSWSNGQTEGQITKLKLVKRQMYGRAKIDLLQARLVDVY